MRPSGKSRLEQENQELRERLKRAEDALLRFSGAEAAPASAIPAGVTAPAGLGEAMLNQMQHMVALINPDYTCRYANSAFLAAFQTGWNDVTGHNIAQLIGEQAFKNGVRNKLDACLAGDAVNHEWTQSYPKLGLRRMFASFLPLSGADAAAILILQDITEHWQQEQVFVDTERRLKKAYTLAMLGDWELDIENDNLYWSDEVYNIFEVDQASYSGKNPPFDMIIHPEDRDLVYGSLQSAMRDRCPFTFTYRLQFADGRIKYLLERGDIEVVEERMRIFGTVQDITEQKTAEMALEHRRRDLLLLKTILDSSTESIWIMNSAAQLMFANSAFERLIGIPYDEMIRHRYQDILPPETLDLINQTIRPRILTHGSWQGVVKMQDSRGRTFPAWAHLGSLCDAQATIQNFYCFMHDDSQRIQAEEDLRAARNAAEAAHRVKSEFLASMSHEIRTPLNAILGFAELLDQSLTDPRLKSYLTPIRSGGETLVTLLNDILDLSRIESGNLSLQTSPVSLPGMFQEVQNMFSLSAAQKGLELSVEVDPRLPRLLMFDEVRLRQILFNLVGNAVKFTRSGFVRLSAQVLAVNQVSSSIDLSIAVADSGIGIPLDQQEIIFEAFRQQSSRQTGSHEGTGLGLAICKRLVENMHGTIRVTSEVDHGAVFSVRLPQVSFLAGAGKVSEFPAAPQPPDLQFTPQPYALDPETLPPLEALELSRLLNVEFLPRWERLRDLQPVGEVRAFADGLSGLGSRYNTAFLTAYAQDLRAALDHFDVACIAYFLAEYPRILATLTCPGDLPR